MGLLKTITKYTSPVVDKKNITTYYTEPNIAPSLGEIRLQVLENETYIFAATDITGSFTDTEGSAPFSVLFETTPLKGKLLNGVKDIQQGDIVPFADITNITYTPPTNAFGIDYTSFKIRVNDDGIAPNPYSEQSRVHVDIGSISPPLVQDNCIDIMQGMNYTFTLADFSLGYQDDNTTEPSFVSFQLPINGTLLNASTPVTSAFTIPANLIGQVEYVPPLTGATDMFVFQVADDQPIFSAEKNMCVKIATIPTFSPIHILRLCYNHEVKLIDYINPAYSNDDGSVLKNLEITFLHAGYSLLLSNVTVLIGDIVQYSDLNNLVLLADQPIIAQQTLEIKFKGTSANNKESLEFSVFATVGEIADYDCEDYDENDYFTFDQ